MHTGAPQSPSAAGGNHFHRYLQYAASVLTAYKGNEPFHLFLKKYFSSNKKHGSRDRKLITALCFDYFRLGYGVSTKTDIEEKLRLGSFLCERNSSLLPGFFKPEMAVSIHLPLHEKLAIVRNQFEVEKIFPFADLLSDEINRDQYRLSFLVQPKLFIRIRPGCRDIIIGKIRNAGLSFEEAGESCLSFANNEKVSSIIDIDKEAVIQDYNSQKTLEIIINEVANSNRPGMSVWDCCAGSGGKSILAFDTWKTIKLTVTDKRKNILENLQDRFNKAGITNYELALADLQLPFVVPATLSAAFDIIIADVPCTGSGTWPRTPEQLTFFSKKDIEAYAQLQKKIIENTVPHLKAGGYFLYITCSVFKKENEENIAFIQQRFPLGLLRMEYLKGYEMQADTLFVALFRAETPDP